MSQNEPQRLTFGQFYGAYLDAVLNNDIAGRAQWSTPLHMAQEAGLVIINDVPGPDDVKLTYSDRSRHFQVEVSDYGPVTVAKVVVPEGMFPELEHYAGGDLLRYATEERP